MKKKTVLIFCEYCNQGWEEISPPTNEQYEKGLIRLPETSTILLPKKFRIVKKGYSVNCARWIGGLYCDKDCLLKYINKILAKKAPEC